jgi:hypothetical protein
MEKQR